MNITTSFEIPETKEAFDLLARLIAMSASASIIDADVVAVRDVTPTAAPPTAAPPTAAPPTAAPPTAAPPTAAPPTAAPPTAAPPTAAPPTAAPPTAAPPTAAPPTAAPPTAAPPTAAPPTAAPPTAAPPTKTDALNQISDDMIVKACVEHSNAHSRAETVAILKSFGAIDPGTRAPHPRFVPPSSRIDFLHALGK